MLSLFSLRLQGSNQGSILLRCILSILITAFAGFYPVNHTDCLQSYLHHCFDGITGELAHAFFPSTGEIHFDDDEYWILGNMRYSWKKGNPDSCLSAADQTEHGRYFTG